jgi:outer membrane biosynthesis protein TonB
MIAFSSTPKFEEMPETVAVDVIDTNQPAEIAKGEKTAKEAKPDPKPRAERVAETNDIKPENADAKRDVPSPVSRPPSTEPEQKAQVPPPPKPPEQQKPEPKKEEIKDEALVKAEKKPDPKPEPPKPEPPKPEPPKPDRKPEPPKPEPPKFEPDKLAKMIEQAKPAPPKSEATDKPFNPNDINKLLESKEKPAQAASTGQQVNKTASLGSATATGQKLNPSQKDQIGSIIKDQLAQCWSPPAGVSDGASLKPVVRVSLLPDGTVTGSPSIANEQSSPAFRAMADSALRAVRKCSPFKIPAQFAPFYNDWKDWTVTFDPKEMLG